MEENGDCKTPTTKTKNTKVSARKKDTKIKKPMKKGRQDAEQKSAVTTSTKNTKKTKKNTKKKEKKVDKQASIDESEEKPAVGLSTLSVPTTPAVLTPPVLAQAAKPSTPVTDVPAASKHTSPASGGKNFDSVAKSWLDKAVFATAKSDYEHIQSMTVNVEKECKKWRANMKKNKSEDFPSLDSTLLKMDDYVNISQVDGVLNSPILMGQIPLIGSEEAFWKAIFEKRAVRVFVCVDQDTYDFFPHNAEDYRNYGSMWVNNRGVENMGNDVKHYRIEILPHGCSNSVISIVSMIPKWSLDRTPEKYSPIIREILEMLNFLKTAQPDETALIISDHGSGRSGHFLALSAAIQKMATDIEPCIADIVKTICMHRPRSEGTFNQYIGLYCAMCHYIKHTAKGGPLYNRAAQLMQVFTEELVADMKQSKMGTVSTGTSAVSVVKQ